jgi:hypothetical protein
VIARLIQKLILGQFADPELREAAEAEYWRFIREVYGETA